MNLPEFKTHKPTNRIKWFGVWMLLIVVLSIFVCGYYKISKERQAVVDYCRTSLCIVIPEKAVKYKGYSKEFAMDRFAVCYNAADYHPDWYSEDDEIPTLNEVFYVERDESFPVYCVYTTEDLIG